MEFHPLSAAFILLCLLGTTIASPPAEEYWHSMLPQTPMPRAIQRLIQPALNLPESYAFNPQVFNILYNIFNYNYAKATTQLKEYNISNMTTIFFLHKDLHAHTKMQPHFLKSSPGPSFLPRKIANTIPFSSRNISQILDRFSVVAESAEAGMIRATLNACEDPHMEGEEKSCSTSLETLVDFNVAKIGKNVQVISTDLQEDSKHQEYTIIASPKLIGNDTILSHKLTYPYAVFYSHWIRNTNVYLVPLEGADGTRIKAVGVCHMDTSVWGEGHIAFHVLKVKPGVAICHFPGSDTLVWISKNTYY